jgi:hypothetical protein
MTECNQSSFGFEASGRREIVARFDGGTISSDGGAFLLRQTDKRLNLLPRLAECFLDGRNQAWSSTRFRRCSRRGSTVWRWATKTSTITSNCAKIRSSAFWREREELDEPLAGKSTLNRMELGTGVNDRYKKITFWKEAVDELLVKVFIESHRALPRDRAGHGYHRPAAARQAGRAFFHGYYDNYCYLPLYVFCGDHVLCARLREANHDAAFGCLAEIQSASWRRFGRRGRK